MSSQKTRFAPKSRSHDRIFARVVLTALFSAVLLWAVVVLLTQMHVDGVVAVALAVVISGAVLATIGGWQEVRALSREESIVERASRNGDDIPVDEVYPLRSTPVGRGEIAV